MKRLSLFAAIVLSIFFLANVPSKAQATGPASAASLPVTRGSTLQEGQICDGGEGVYLYEHSHYQGRCVKLTADVADLSVLNFNNIGSSIEVVGDWTATLYIDQNYSGAFAGFTQDEPDLGRTTVGNDRASSVRVLRGSVPAGNVCDGREGVYLYEDTQYRGRCAKFTVSTPDLSDLGFSNVVSSIAFVGDWTATLYVDQNYSGASVVFTQDDPDLGNNTIGNDRGSSLLVQRGNVPEGNVCDGGEGVYLYEHPFYQGRCAKFTGDAPDLRTLAFDDMASSVRIVGNWTAVLYRDLSSTGTASTFTQDDTYLGDNPIGDNQVTSLQARRGNVPEGNACDGGEGVYLYEHASYQGRCAKFTGDVPDLRTLGFDDMASSVAFVGNWTATLARDLSYTGITSTFTQPDPDLNNDAVGNDQTTSLRVHRGNVPAGNICDGGEGVYLYEHPFYQGRCVRFTGDAPDLRTLSFDDMASSVAFVGNWTVTLYRDLSGTGIASTFTQAIPYLGDYAVGDNHVTSLQARRR